MAHCLVNDTPETFEFSPETWGQLLDSLDRTLVADRRVVTAVRFDGVDQPTFRSPELAAADLGRIGQVEVEAEDAAALLGAAVAAADDSLPGLVNGVRTTAASLRAGAPEAQTGLVALVAAVQSLVALTAAAATAANVSLGAGAGTAAGGGGRVRRTRGGAPRPRRPSGHRAVDGAGRRARRRPGAGDCPLARRARTHSRAGPGMNIHCEHPAPGSGSIFFPSSGALFFYRCDPQGHRVVVIDEAGHVVRAFGGFGRKPGCLDTPLDLVFVRPQFAGEHLPADSADTVWMAVADYGNRRVQIFELDGTVVGELHVDGSDGRPWPPTALSWRGPVLEITGIEGVRTAVHLSAALLANDAAPGRPVSPLPHLAQGARH